MSDELTIKAGIFKVIEEDEGSMSSRKSTLFTMATAPY
jgi:hypothetical protein